jgi:predicted nucleic acid-binding protein
MKISVDTNVLARAVLNDDPAQSRVARKLLKEASLIAVPLPCLCVLVWVLRQSAKLPKDDVATAMRRSASRSAASQPLSWPDRAGSSRLVGRQRLGQLLDAGLQRRTRALRGQ